ncbi:carbon-nitrogen hydrolase family protein [Aliikangiella coralliicola]|uniref:Carbon-nitrogen hydrolase family protein n=1 Tax=Aliikangiella coralliicola TaxID=2592383 RepID=A0A545U5X0_9GAMM|nr:carbon-nitrogen hydrolase family protein [Aliikangiella coralliicola]TQV84856.1 carbon-nitrogen hydrolase family protein [Aliikangiella coralliicola]
MSQTKIGALQIGSALSSSKVTIQKVLDYESQIKDEACELIVLPEALIGGYPKGWDFGTRIGYRKEVGREQFLHYWNQTVNLQTDDLKDIRQMAKRTQTNLIIGVIEKVRSSLYCTTAFISNQGELNGVHRKLMPTASERLIWAQGDGSTMPLIKTENLKAGSVICWENYMPLLRSHMYSKDLNLWCASTVDDREIWQASMRHIAYEGRMFLISACQYLGSPSSLGFDTEWPDDKELIRGGSVIVSPMGEVLAGPIYGEEKLLSAEINLDDVIKARYDFDASGHYSRPDIFKLNVDQEERIKN